jgi:hypothetical protein
MIPGSRAFGALPPPNRCLPFDSLRASRAQPLLQDLPEAFRAQRISIREHIPFPQIRKAIDRVDETPRDLLHPYAPRVHAPP